MAATQGRMASLLDHHQAAVNDFFTRAAQVTSDRWNQPRAAGKWSPAQEVKHVILSYDAFIRDLEGGEGMRLIGTPLKRAFWRAIGMGVVTVLRRLPRGAPAPRESRPPDGDYDQQALLGEFRSRTDRFDLVFRDMVAQTPGRRVTHPYFGLMDLDAALRLVTVHTRHHEAVLPPCGPRQQVGA